MLDGNAGKGSKYRPVNRKKWDENWEKAFGNNKTDVINKDTNVKRGNSTEKDDKNE
jgi:hypothetical protein